MSTPADHVELPPLGRQTIAISDVQVERFWRDGFIVLRAVLTPREIRAYAPVIRETAMRRFAAKAHAGRRPRRVPADPGSALRLRGGAPLLSRATLRRHRRPPAAGAGGAHLPRAGAVQAARRQRLPLAPGPVLLAAGHRPVAGAVDAAGRLQPGDGLDPLRARLPSLRRLGAVSRSATSRRITSTGSLPASNSRSIRRRNWRRATAPFTWAGPCTARRPTTRTPCVRR